MGKYLLLIWGDEAQWEAMSPEDQAAEFEAYTTYGNWLRDKGWMHGGEALQPAATSVQVRLREGQVLTTDGPFAETKEQLGGYYLIDTESLEEAVDAASKIPAARGGIIEVKPVLEFGLSE
jgi:hypothetical protein